VAWNRAGRGLGGWTGAGLVDGVGVGAGVVSVGAGVVSAGCATGALPASGRVHAGSNASRTTTATAPRHRRGGVLTLLIGMTMVASDHRRRRVGSAHAFMQLDGTRGASHRAGRGGAPRPSILVEDREPDARIRRLQPQRPVGTVAIVMLDVDPKDPLQVAAPDDWQPGQAPRRG
jgi:hypothetical protein